MKYLSKAIIKKTEALKLGICDNYRWHIKIWDSFPNMKEKKRDFLFRISDKMNCFLLLLLSPEKIEIPSWGDWQTKEIPQNFLSHQYYKFELRANPTKKMFADPQGNLYKKSKRVGIYNDEDLGDWLERKAQQSGFDLLNYIISPPQIEIFSKDKKRCRHNKVDFSGVLKVNDHKLFQEAFNQGIGSAKGFGFGMLILDPINSKK